MKGSPLARIAAAALGLALIGILLSRLTGGEAAAPISGQSDPISEGGANSPPTAASVAAVIRIRVSHPPEQLRLLHGDRVLADLRGGAALQWEADAELAIPPEDGIELTLEATWAGDVQQAAATVELEPEGLDAQSRTAWSDGAEMVEYLDFTW